MGFAPAAPRESMGFAPVAPKEVFSKPQACSGLSACSRVGSHNCMGMAMVSTTIIPGTERGIGFRVDAFFWAQ